MLLSSGDKIGQYEILAPIGAGGMGEVYRAKDLRLGREVAVKVLPAGMAHNDDRLARFQREARAVAALNHPHIVTIFSVEEAGGVHFLTMELVDGQPLDRLIPESGLPIGQIVEIASALGAVNFTLTGTRMPDSSGRTVRLVGLMRDTTERTREVRRLTYLATRDELTGHLNRNSLRAELTQAIERARVEERHCAFLVASIDRLAMIVADVANIREVVPFPTLKPRAD